MTTPEAGCVAPGRPHPAHPHRLCGKHLDKLGQWLADIVDLYATLDPRLSMGSDTTGSSHHPLASTRAPVRLAVTALTDRRRGVIDGQPDLLALDSIPSAFATLHTYAAPIRRARNIRPPAQLTVITERLVVVRHLEWAADQYWAEGLYRDIRTLWAALRAANGMPAPRPAARCWVPALQAVCDGPVWTDPGTAWCSKCGASWSGADLLRISSVLNGAA